jgi:divalent metal cation (Fe/Co/Zn/Cd) transporter
MTAPTATITTQRRAALNRRSLQLAYATAGYNLLEGLIAVTAGAAASSVALLGFGLDSFVEVASALVVIWQFRSRVPEARERLALRGIAVSFFALAAWVTFDAGRALLGQEKADTSAIGIGVAAASLMVMPLLVWAKRRTGRELGSATVVADSMQTMLCTYLSAIVLGGLLLNATLGWWWADPLAALIVAVVAVREGLEAWRGEHCDDCALPTTPSPTAATSLNIVTAGQAPACGCGPGCTDACHTPGQPAPDQATHATADRTAP